MGEARYRKIEIAGSGSFLFYRESSELAIQKQRPKGSKGVRHVTLWEKGVAGREKNSM